MTIGSVGIKFKATILALKKLLSRPSMLILSLLISLLVLFLVLWLNNYGALIDVLASDLSLSGKWDFLVSTPQILHSSYEPWQAVTIVSFSLLQGLNVAFIVAIARLGGWKSLLGASSSSGAAGVAVIFGAGCGVCGTTLLAPLAASIGASSGIWFERLGSWLLIAAVLLLAYSIYKLGQIYNHLWAKAEFAKNTPESN